MMNQLLSWPLLLVALSVFGFLPGLVARLVALSFHKDDPRRRELVSEVYAVPRWERPFWVAEQLERALSEGIWERLIYTADGRLFNRWTLGDAIARNADYPDTFEIPSEDELANLKPGDGVKLMFEAKGRLLFREGGLNGERMWVAVTNVNRGSYEGTLDNHPVVWNHLYPGDKIRFSRQHIIDYESRDD
jgi:hypothetical protein